MYLDILNTFVPSYGSTFVLSYESTSVPSKVRKYGSTSGSTGIWKYTSGSTKVLPYFRTKIRKYLCTEVRKYESTSVPSYFRKYFRYFRKYGSTFFVHHLSYAWKYLRTCVHVQYVYGSTGTSGSTPLLLPSKEPSRYSTITSGSTTLYTCTEVPSKVSCTSVLVTSL